MKMAKYVAIVLTVVVCVSFIFSGAPKSFAAETIDAQSEVTVGLSGWADEKDEVGSVSRQNNFPQTSDKQRFEYFLLGGFIILLAAIIFVLVKRERRHDEK